jgi:hypothetical protein
MHPCPSNSAQGLLGEIKMQATQSNNQAMYGVNNIDQYIASVKNSLTYKLTGANMIVAGLMSDAQEQMGFGDTEGARKTLNLAKAVLFEIMDGNLAASVKE